MRSSFWCVCTFVIFQTQKLERYIGTGFVLNDTGGGGAFAAVPVRKKNTVYIWNL